MRESAVMGESTPLHWSDPSLDPVMASARVTPASRDEDRRHQRDPEDASEQDSRSRDNNNSGAGEEIVDTVTLSEAARKLLATESADTATSEGALQPAPGIDAPVSIRQPDRVQDARNAYHA